MIIFTRYLQFESFLKHFYCFNAVYTLYFSLSSRKNAKQNINPLFKLL